MSRFGEEEASLLPTRQVTVCALDPPQTWEEARSNSCCYGSAHLLRKRMGAITIGGLTVAAESCCRQQLGELVYDQMKLPMGLGNTASPLRN
jgi:hypothetical protein